jgi:hypothetical protein
VKFLHIHLAHIQNVTYRAATNGRVSFTNEINEKIHMKMDMENLPFQVTAISISNKLSTFVAFPSAPTVVLDREASKKEMGWCKSHMA